MAVSSPGFIPIRRPAPPTVVRLDCARRAKDSGLTLDGTASLLAQAGAPTSIWSGLDAHWLAMYGGEGSPETRLRPKSPLDLRHTAVWVVPDDTLDVVALRKVLMLAGNQRVGLRPAARRVRLVTNQKVKGESVRVALNLWADIVRFIP